MASSRLETLTIKFLLSFILLLLLCPLYMYFSHDVQTLEKKYPHPHIKDSAITFELKDSKPRNWVGLHQISKYGVGAIVLSEDWGFYQHKGFDANQMKAAFNDMIERKRFRGASTISQQMVKNVFLDESRTIWRKVHEFILTQKVEQVLEKKRILEVYLNVIEFGPGIYGINDASQHFFRKPPSMLNAREAAFLAMLLPSPKRYYVSYKKKKLTKFAKDRVDAILIKMRMGKILTPAQYKAEVSSRLSWEK